MLVKLDHFPKARRENKKCLKFHHFRILVMVQKSQTTTWHVMKPWFYTLVPRKCFQTPIEINASILALKSEIFRHCSTARPKKKLSWFLNTEVQKFEMGPAKMLFSKTVSLKSRRSWEREIDFVKFFQFVEMTCVLLKKKHAQFEEVVFF